MSLPQPAAARLFVPAQEPHDMVRFGDLRPLADGAPWSVIALIRPQQVTWHGGIICRRSGFQAGRHQFSFWLGDGALALGAGDKVRQSNLRPALNEWSIVAASASPEGCDFYIGGSDGVVTQESLPGLQSGSDNEAEPLRIGNLGDSFPGLIALICLVSGRLHPLTVRSVCAGNISPLGLPNLVFAWQPGLRGDVDLVSRRVPEIRGTRLWTGQEPLPQISAAAPAAAPLRVPADTGFLIAGHSHLFALGALQGYKGGIDMQPVEAGGVRGAFLMEEWRGSRSHDYWSTLVRSGRDRPVFILYNGNQHYGEFMFSSEAFDFLEHDADEPGAAPLVPRKLVQAYFKRTLPELNRILGELRGAEASSFLHAVNSGHPGSLTSVHADSPALAFERLALMVMQGNAALSREQILAYLRGVVDIVIQVRKVGGRRQVAGVYYKHGPQGE